MGYDVHITRRANWYDNGDDINETEWQSFIKIRSDLPLCDAHGDTPFYWSMGCIDVKNPSEELLVLMYEVAQALKARVQGDDGEFYEYHGKTVQDKHTPVAPSKRELKEQIRSSPYYVKPWWKFW